MTQVVAIGLRVLFEEPVVDQRSDDAMNGARAESALGSDVADALITVFDEARQHLQRSVDGLCARSVRGR